MPRRRTGTIQPFTDSDGRRFYRARIRLADSSRVWKRVPDGYSEAKAREFAAHYQELEDEHGAELARKTGAPVAGETVETWVGRWLDERKARGIASVGHDRSRLTRHVLPILGRLQMAKVTRADVERLVEALDAQAKRGFTVDKGTERRRGFEWKSASNVWVLVTKMFDDSTNAKRRDLRVRDDNPAAGVKGPDRGDSKARQYLYPSEFLKLVSCEEIDLEFRTLYAAAVYTFMRAGELEALTWADVDLEHGVIHINPSTAPRAR